MIDRAQQALHLLALEPISETLADPNSYGFRPNRCVADAIQQCFTCLCKKGSAKWVLEGDIKACFDKIGHQWLIDNIPTDKRMLRQWLGCGFIDKGVFCRTEEGTPQGGIISPTLMLLTLAGLENFIKSKIPTKADKIHFISYADDFVITGASKEVLVNKVKPLVSEFLKERNLTLSEEKTQVTHIEDGFDFLGFNIRKYKGKLLTKPSKSSVLLFIQNMRQLIRKHPTIKVEELIRMMNPKLRGWANYYSFSAAKRIFSYVNSQIFQALWRWANRRHPNKSKKWIAKKYFLSRNGYWIFHGRQFIAGMECAFNLVEISRTPICRHNKIKGAATPYDPEYATYLNERKVCKTSRNSWNTPVMLAL